MFVKPISGKKVILCKSLKWGFLWKVNNIFTILNIQFQVCFIFTAKANAYANKKSFSYLRKWMLVIYPRSYSEEQNLKDNPHTIAFFLVKFLLYDINFYSKKDSFMGSFLKIFFPRSSFCSLERLYEAFFLLLKVLGKL